MRPYIRDRREQCENDETVRLGGSCGVPAGSGRLRRTERRGSGLHQGAVQTILDSGAFTDELDELDCDTAWALYQLEEAGLSREDLTDGVIYRSAGATCEELSLLIFSDSGAAQTAQGALEAYLQSQIENNRDYRPGEIPKLEDAVLRQEGSTVLLAVSADTPAVEALLG